MVSLADAAKIPHQNEDVTKYWHWFNHLLISPTGERFIFLNRWRKITEPTAEAVAKEPFHTRMFTANADGSDLYVLDPSGNTSHFIWRDPDSICAWTKPIGKKAAFYLLRDRTQEVEIVGEEKMPVNGHNTYLPIRGKQWILNDTYPDRNRIQTPYLYNVETDTRIDLGRFHSPREYAGGNRGASIAAICIRDAAVMERWWRSIPRTKGSAASSMSSRLRPWCRRHHECSRLADPLAGRRRRTRGRQAPEEAGYRILARQTRNWLGEIDLIALDGDTIVFVEVKARRGNRDGSPAEAVDSRKQRKLTQLALVWLKKKKLLGRRCRFDVVAVRWDDQGRMLVEHFRNAFEAVDFGQMY